MTESIVRETLREVRDTVDVPLIDHAGLASRTRRLRRRRRALQAAAAGAATAAVVGGAFAIPALVSQPESVVATTVPAGGLPVVLADQIQLVRPDGTVSPTGHVGTPIGVVDGQLAWLDEGVLRGPDDLRVEHVRVAFASESGVSYQLTDGTTRVAGSREPVESTGGSTGDLVAVGADAFVTEEHDGALTLHTSSGSHELQTGSDGSSAPATAVEVGEESIMVAAGGVVSFFDRDGSRTGGFLGGVTGALSPDGSTYVYAPDAGELAQGMRPGLVTYDVASDTMQRVRLDGAAVDVAWAGDGLVVLTEQRGSRTLSECHDNSCEVLLTDPSGTLALE